MAVLIVIDKPFAIGLYVRYFSHLVVVQSFFQCALDVHCSHAGCGALLELNPHVRRTLLGVPIESIDLTAYHTVLVYSTEQPASAARIRERLPQGTQMFLLYDDEEGCPRCDPPDAALSSHFRSATIQAMGHLLPNRLHVSNDEVDWGSRTLAEHGLRADEVAIIALDDASRREKLLRIPDHVAMLRHFLRFPNVRVVCFDEKRIGKSRIYERLLSDRDYDRMLFLSGLDLRRVIRVMASPCCRVVFGPGTGLLHCASALHDSPNAALLIGYVGSYGYHAFDEWFWWGNSRANIVLKTPNGARLLGPDLADGAYLKLPVLPCASIRGSDIAGLVDEALRGVLGPPVANGSG